MSGSEVDGMGIVFVRLFMLFLSDGEFLKFLVISIFV